MIRPLAVATALAVLAFAVVVTSIGDPRGTSRYTREEVVRAFAELGFGLRQAREIRGPETPLFHEGSWVRGSNSGDFIVYVAPTSSVARGLRTRHVNRPDLRPARFSVLEGNVYVESLDPRLGVLERKRVQEAMHSLRSDA